MAILLLLFCFNTCPGRSVSSSSPPRKRGSGAAGVVPDALGARFRGHDETGNDEPRTRRNSPGPAASGRVHPRGSSRRAWLVGERGGEGAGRARATLSDLINGNAALSAEMALRIEKAFGVKMETLLNLQAWHDAHAMRQREDEIAVKPYRPPAPEPG